jgi:vacuolar-type H+-ATPase catalytic subunit A/Vma1
MIKKSAEHPPIRGLILANSGQGKTYWLSDYVRSLLGKQWSPKRVIIISKTFKSDSSIAPLIEVCRMKKKNFLEQNCFDDVDAGVKFLTQLVDT